MLRRVGCRGVAVVTAAVLITLGGWAAVTRADDETPPIEQRRDEDGGSTIEATAEKVPVPGDRDNPDGVRGTGSSSGSGSGRRGSGGEPWVPDWAKNSPVWADSDYEYYQTMCAYMPGAQELPECQPGNPGGPAVPRIDPGVAARRAVARIGLRAVVPVLTPDWRETRDEMIPVGFPVWVSAARGSLAAVSDAESIEGLNVSLEAGRPKMVVDMGDGTKLRCVYLGRRFSYRDKPGAEGPCSHRYAKMSEREGYTVTAIYTWDVDWVAGGQSGTITVTDTASMQLPVGEYHALITGGR